MPKLRHGTHSIWNLARQAVVADTDVQEARHRSHCVWNLAKEGGGRVAAQIRKSRIARFPELRAWNRKKIRSEELKHESNRSRIAENRFRIAIRIANPINA